MRQTHFAQGKGINFRGLLDAIRALYGQEAERAVIGACTGEMGALLSRGGLTAGAWYDVAWYRQLHAAAQSTLRRPELARECARWSIQRDLGGIYRILLFLLTPESVISKCPRIMQQYWRGGVMQLPEVRHGMAAVEFKGWVGFDQNIWQDIIGGVEGGLAAAGAQSIRVRVINGGHDNDPDLGLEVRWTSRSGKPSAD